MARQQHSIVRLYGKMMSAKQLAPCLAAVLLAALGVVTPAPGQDYWTGEGADNRWDNADNWASGFVPDFGEIRVNGPEAEGMGGPLIEDGIDAVAGVLIADAGEPVMTMTGGSLELNGWGTWWSDAPGTLANFNMSGGIVEFTGSPGIMEVAWQDAGDPPGSSVGIWTMTGGEVIAKGVDMPGKNHGGTGIINLWGGTLNVGLERGGLMLYEGAQLDITEGVLVLEGDQSATVENYIGDGWLTAYAGAGELTMEYDGEFTTVSAINVVVGDFNNDRLLDAVDIDLLTLESASGNNTEKYDLNDDTRVDDGDVNVWVKDLFKSWIGDADLNGEFNSGDLVAVLSAGKYEVDEEAVWSTGDFNGDGRANSSDLVAALTDGGYEQGPRAAVNAVPEPASWLMLLMAAAAIAHHPFSRSGRRGPQAG